jgi:integrase
MARAKSLLHVKRTRAKGRIYYYFRTGQKGTDGKEILNRLPDLRDPGFGASYAAHLGVRTKRDQVAASTAELTVPQLCGLYERSPHFRGLSAGTQRLYGISLRHLCEMLPSAPAGLLERKDVVRLVDRRADQPGAANSLLRLTSALFKWGRERGHVDNDPCRDIAMLDVGEHLPWPEHILEAALCADDDRVRLAVHLLLYTAQRIGDVVRMRWTDIRDGRLHVEQQKTGRALSIPLHGRLAAELERNGGRIGYILAGASGRPLQQGTLRDALKAFAADRGARVVPHGLRKNAVNSLLEAGCSAAETASISGQSLQMVEHYAKRRAQSRLADAAVLKWQGHRR